MEYLSSSLGSVVKEIEEDMIWSFITVIKTFTRDVYFKNVHEKTCLQQCNWELLDRIEENINVNSNGDVKQLRKLSQELGKLVFGSSVESRRA